MMREPDVPPTPPVPAPRESLSVRLSEIERWARLGNTASPNTTLELVSILRQYMAHVETIQKGVEMSLSRLSGAF